MKRLLPNLKLLLFLIFLSLILLLFDSMNLLKFPKTLVQTFTVPVQYGFYKTGLSLGNQFGFIFSARTAAQENKALRLQLATVFAENANLQKKLTETEGLVDSFNKLNPQTYNLMPARVIALSRFLTIDKGSNDGVSVNQVVVFKDSFVGVVQKVEPKSAQVLLSSDPDSKIAVFSQGNDGRARGMLAGQFGSEALMDKILHEEKVNKDDLVYSEGTEGKLPRGLVMGKITEVMERKNEVFKRAKVEPIFKAADLDVVFVIGGS
ncbi:rod shape-determining protein MreC [Candidatus Daviesbacteria bacterium]|nr:rod shape-determining protein MreC [Candidatus Daviesbacteria bacterium]